MSADHLCGALHPDRDTSCTLEPGHDGDHLNRYKGSHRWDVNYEYRVTRYDPDKDRWTTIRPYTYATMMGALGSWRKRVAKDEGIRRRLVQQIESATADTDPDLLGIWEARLAEVSQAQYRVERRPLGDWQPVAWGTP